MKANQTKRQDEVRVERPSALPCVIATLLAGLLAVSTPLWAQTDSTTSGATDGEDQEQEEVGEFIDEYTLPTAAAPVAIGSSIISSTPVGQNTQRALNAPRGVGLDANTGFYPSLTIGYSWHDNPARVAGGEGDEDESLRIIPALTYRGNVNNRHPYELTVAADLEEFDEFASLDREDLLFNGAILLDITEILKVDLYGSYEEGSDPRGATATRNLTVETDNDEYERETLGGRVTIGRRSNTLQLVVDAETSDIDYTNNNQQARDRSEDGYGAGLFWNVGPRTSLFISGRQRDFDYTSGLVDDFDSTETFSTIGVGWEPSYTTSLLLEAGNLKKEFDEPGNPDYDDETYRGKLTWFATQNTSVGLYASKRTEESTEVLAPFIVSELVGVSLQHSFTDRFRGNAFYNVIDDDVVNVRQDDITDYGLGVFYDVRRWMTLGASWVRTDRESTDPGAEYESDSFNVTLTLRPVKPVRFGDPELQTSSDVQTAQ